MATKPSNLAEWATGAAPIVEPSTPQKQAGWSVGFKPPAQWFNWWMNIMHLWVLWLDAFESEAHTWTGLQTFNNATQFNSSITVAGTSSLSTVSIGPSGTFQALKKAIFDIADSEVPAIERAQTAATPHLLFQQLVDGSRKLRVYITVDLGLMVTYNARWNVAGSNWVRDVASDAWRQTMGKSFQLFRAPAGGGSFVEGAWITNFNTLDPFGGGFDALATGTVWYGVSNGVVEAGRHIPQLAWTNLTLSANLTAVVGDEPQYYRDTTGRVWMRGAATANTTIVSGSQVGTLPAAFAYPDRPMTFPLAIVDLAIKYQLVFQTSGRIDMQCGTPGNILTGTVFNFANLSYRSG